MLRLLVPIVAAVPLLAAAATAWGAPPIPAKPIDGSVQFGFPGAGVPVGPVEDQIYPAPGGLPPMTELTAPLPITAGGTVTFNVDGPHQPLVYRLHNGETVEAAIDTLQTRANEAIPNPNGPLPLRRQRMAGQDPFPSSPPTPIDATVADELTAADRDFGFRYLSETKVPPANTVPVTSPPLGAGTYIMLCNFRAHSFRVAGPLPLGAGENMRAIIDAAPNGPA